MGGRAGEELAYAGTEGDAEGSANKLTIDWTDGIYSFDIDDIKQAYLDGLHEGQPKWHKVSEGDLPKDNKMCLLYLGSNFNPITGWIEDGIWYFEDDRKNGVWQIKVIAWKEIVLPQFKE